MDSTPTKPDPHSPMGRYHSLVAAGELTPDKGQAQVMAILQRHYERLHGAQLYQKRSFLARLFGKKPSLEGTQGTYVWGDVGRGKSMIMDVFYDAITDIPKQRIHFHAFMRDVHARMHAWRQLRPDADLLPRVVEEIAGKTKLLCFDELQVHDVTDAMILSRLFTLLFERGLVIVFTSNRPPDALYQGGIQRDQFLQFIGLIKQKMDILELVSPTDYRLKQLRSLERTYITPLGPDAQMALYDIYCALTQGHESVPVTIQVTGRNLLVEKTAGGVAWLTFNELCERPLGASDYIELAKEFHTILLQDIPELIPEKRNEAKRFVTLIDAIYEHKTTFICTADAPPDALYPLGDGSFEFARTVSRLIEMQSERYIGQEHVA